MGRVFSVGQSRPSSACARERVRRNRDWGARGRSRPCFRSSGARSGSSASRSAACPEASQFSMCAVARSWSRSRPTACIANSSAVIDPADQWRSATTSHARGCAQSRQGKRCVRCWLAFLAPMIGALCYVTNHRDRPVRARRWESANRLRPTTDRQAPQLGRSGAGRVERQRARGWLGAGVRPPQAGMLPCLEGSFE